MDKDEAEEFDTGLWMLTFSDLLSLLLTFFVLLFALKAMDKGKLEELLGYFREGGMGTLEMGKEMSVSQMHQSEELVSSRVVFSLKELKEVMDSSLKGLKVADKVSYGSDERGLVVTLSDVVLFDSGSSDIKPEAKLILDSLTGVLRKNEYHIMIEGHTDNLPISTEQFSSNWELSIDRAVKVLRYFVESNKLSPERFSAVGYGETRPLFPNVDLNNRRKNRRVELILTPPDKI